MSKPMKTSVDPRHEARKIALQTLFAWSFQESQKYKEMADWVLAEMLPAVCDRDMLERLISGVVKHKKELDILISRCAPEWPILQLSKIDLNILRIAILEFYIEKSVPTKVAIDEAVELAKEFGSETSSSFVNGALGTLVKLFEKNITGDKVLYIGEFQPLHKGHIHTILHLSKRYKTVIFGVMNSDSVKSSTHPMEFSEQKEMMDDVLGTLRVENHDGEEIDVNFEIIPLSSLKETYVDEVNSIEKDIGVVYTANAQVTELFGKNGFTVFKELQLLDPITDESVRKNIRLGQKWYSLVPKKVEKYLKRKYILSRIQNL